MKQASAFLLFMMLAGAADSKHMPFFSRRSREWAAPCRLHLTKLRSGLRKRSSRPSARSRSLLASGEEVDKRDVHLDHSDSACLIVSLPKLETGTYKVVWRVVSVDTHVTEGNFSFHVR